MQLLGKAIIETFSGVKANLQKAGNLIDDQDLIMASTTLTMNYILVTITLTGLKGRR